MSKYQLQLFGFSLSVVISFWISVYLYFRVEPFSLVSMLLYFPAALIATLVLFKPFALRPVYQYWTLVVEFINKIITWFLMSLIFFLLITPVALVWRVMGKSIEFSGVKNKTNVVRSNKITKKDMENPY